VKYIIEKYKNSIQQLKTIQEEHQELNKQEEARRLEKELVLSISGSLQEPQEIKRRTVDLDQLEQRIDRLYGEILTFKKTTLQQHEENTHKVHRKIDQIAEIINKREEHNQKLEGELKMLKTEHENVYKLVEQMRSSYPRLSQAI
jgi:uncharacterized protein (DUF3084 family)